MKNRIHEFLSGVKSQNWFWYIKRLSGNDTLANGSHQAGLYIPKNIIFHLFPELSKSSEVNPRIKFSIEITSHLKMETEVSVIWYNNKISGAGTRNECRLTGWGGQDSPILDPDSTGSICFFAFHQNIPNRNADYCKIWLTCNINEEKSIEAITGEIEPGRIMVRNMSYAYENDDCALNETNIPKEWIKSFPSGEEIINRTFLLKPNYIQLKPDIRIIKRRDCEFSIFLAVEKLIVFPLIQKGFTSLEDFIDLANSVANRRKSRAGKSLEIHASRIFNEEGLHFFSYNAITEGQKRPDFIFPNITDYHNKKYPENKLRMLAVKTTCKDRWRQVIHEAKRIKKIHLLTLQEGISENQFSEMKEEGVILVVPDPLHRYYSKSIRKDITGFDQFIRETKNLY